jgi:hypothetical protein
MHGMCLIDGDFDHLRVDYAPFDDGEPVWSETDHEAFTEWAIANDPEQRHAATVDEILAAAESGPITPALMGQLQSLDVSSLDAAQALSYSLGWQRICHHTQAQVAAGVAQTVRAYPTNPLFNNYEGSARELEAALRLGPRQTDNMISVSLDLTARLRDTWDAVNAGGMSWGNAEILAGATGSLDDDKARAVQAATLPRAGERTSARHRDAVRRAVDRIDPEGADERRKQKQHDIRMFREHLGDGVGRLLLDMPSERVDLCHTGADVWARQQKAAGDPRTLDELRCEAFAHWAISMLFHGDGSHCDQHCTRSRPGGGEPSPPGSGSAPTRQGRPAELEAIWDLTSLLGRTNNCGELADSGAVLPPSSMRDLVAGGVRIRRMVIDPGTGELLDLTPGSWFLAATHRGSHRQPVCIKVIVDNGTVDALLANRLDDLDPALVAAINTAHPSIRAMLAAPLTAEDLDARPDDERPDAALSEFIATRDRYPTNPSAGPSSAKAADREHTIARSQGGKTVRENLTSVVRRWHNPKTHGGWATRKVNRDWQWTSPLGRTYTTRPFDFRLGP